MKKINHSENKEIFELKNKCRVVQDKISRVVESMPVRNNINNIKNISDVEGINKLDYQKEDEKTSNV